MVLVECSAAASESPVRAWSLAVAGWLLSKYYANQEYQPKNGAIVGGPARTLVKELTETVGGKWVPWSDGETRVWIAMRETRRKLLGVDALVVCLGAGDVTDDQGLEWIRSGLAEIYRQPMNPRVVIGVEVGRRDVDEWLCSGAWGLVDATLPVARIDTIRKALRGA